MIPQFYETIVINNQKLPNDVFLLELESPKNFNFKAGQFVLVYQKINDKEENRAFSISSSPSQKTIELLIKRFDNGKISPKLLESRKNDKLKIRGPFGMFTLDNAKQEELIFIAAGTGIAPLRSMIHEILEKNPNKKVSLIFGFRHENDYFFKEEFETLQKIHKNFTIHPCSSKPPENWSYLKGRVTNHIPLIIKSPENKHVYICGPNQMINDTLNLLIKQLNFQKDQVYLERWGIN